MINELHQLNTALQEAGISADSWHRRYGPISNITARAPCLRIVLDGTAVAAIEQCSGEKGANIRRYGDNQGSFPAMNLAALYRITDEEKKKAISRLIKDGGEFDLDEIMRWCVTDNWTTKFRRKYKQNFESRPNELFQMLQGENTFQPLLELIAAIEPFKDADALHQALTDTAFRMLRSRRGVAPALQMLFYLPPEGDKQTDEAGKLSVVLDSYDLEDAGFSTIGPNFAKGLNLALLRADNRKQGERMAEAKDAFGRSYTPFEEPMPKVKLAAGFDVSLRTMFKGQPCQHRYGRIENATYPISKEERTELSAALEWLSGKEQQNKTWTTIGKGEAMFIFPSKLSETIPQLAELYQPSFDALQKEALFEAKAKDFTEYVTKTKEFDPEHYPEWIKFFVLRKLDKARTKIVYTYNAKADDIICRSSEWQRAARNLPTFHFGTPWIPFPLRIAQILNHVWKQDGTLASDKYEEVAAFYGMELFFHTADIDNALRSLLRNALPLAAYAGSRLNAHLPIDSKKQLLPLKETLALLGMLLYWENIRKDEYMNEYPYLFGQLLKAADGLHELYCRIERGGQIPSQLAGSSMYQAAMEFPRQTLAQLAQRLAPYLSWARSHMDKSCSIPKENGESITSPTAGYYLYIFKEIAEQLSAVLTDQTRFDDTEKAQLFIGYLAAFPKKESKEMTQRGQTVKMNLKGEHSNE